MYAGILETHEIGTTDEPKDDELGVRSTLYAVALVTVHFEQVFSVDCENCFWTPILLFLSVLRKEYHYFSCVISSNTFHVAYLCEWDYPPPQRLGF